MGEAFALEEAEDALGFGGEVGEAGEPPAQPSADGRAAIGVRRPSSAPSAVCRCRAGGGAEERAAA